MLLCWAAFGCSAPMNSPGARQMPNAPPPAPGTPEGHPPTPGVLESGAHPAPDTHDELPQSVRLVAVTDAPDFALRPRLEGQDQIIVPLPPDRKHLVSVEVGLLVTRRDTGEIMDQQKKIFSWKTLGSALRFYLPPLPSGDYVAEVRTTSTIRTTSNGEVKEVQLPDKAQVAIRSGGTPVPDKDREASPAGGIQAPDKGQLAIQLQNQARTLRSHEFKYHFEPHHAAGATPKLIQEEQEMLGSLNVNLRTTIRNNQVDKVTLDCWASSDGDSNYNMLVSRKRCAWVRQKILRSELNTSSNIKIIEASHGEDNPPEPEPAGINDDELQAIQKRNRVVILKVYTSN